MVRAAFFDIDGTLISFQTHQVPESTKQALYALREKGVKLFVATGRARQTATYLREVFDFAFDGYITLNGQCCLVGDKIIHRHPIPQRSIASLLPYLQQKQIACGFIEDETYYVNLENEQTEKFYKLIGSRTILGKITDPSRALTHDVYQLGAFVSEEEEKEMMQYLPDCRCARWHPLFTDVIPKNGGKNVGIDHILQYFDIPLSQSIAFGDGGNDLEMLQHAQIGVAMGNAVDSVKQIADFVTKSVDEDGIAYALEQLHIL